MLRIAICDDDKLDRDRLHEYVDQYLYERSAQAEVRVFDHPDTLIQECESFRPQVYLLDIVMPMVTGIQAARELRWNQPDAQIIFATSESSYALESFDVNPINYILKPVDKEKLFSTLDLALSRVQDEDKKSITIKIKGGLCTLRIDEVMYIDYRNHVVTYHMANGEIVSTPTLRIGFSEYMEENHSTQDFVRCHESISVNISAVDKLTKTDITLRNKETVPVSKSRYNEVADSYMNYRF
ncbi:LytR/AlgR family response regulator transcription factor [Pseudobutyrivibrio xylanivorans]|uniref:Stage 0 sporulation protein A homolog n=1 Tax=Pseudobutyrivibrio xylanivorans DSM 14809 TaxID=1123012 RepID=A0A1M6ANV7_PSEXY|nr:LytTR family DNA-binding domain-containing protein [Pseudobutyrivibrio xylanivorans]SHI38018.1 two component transcriptional regulator, LytTR family [Pseudobutyrivibrio xylanivorans DSM 14809]